MAIKFSNLASTTLASGVSDTATSLSVTSASSFPSLGGSDYFYASIGRGSGSEIVKVTALTGTTLTVVRGQDDTTAISHASGVEFALRVTAASLNDLSTQADTESVSIAGDTMTGALTVPALDITGNTTTSGTIDGRDVATDGTKLDGIESGATADQTASEIKTAYESNSDTNAFTDADESKLGGIESGATADQTASEIKAAYESNSDTNAFTDAAESKLSGIEASADVTDTTNVTAAGALMDSEVTNLTQVKAFDSSDYATAAQGTTADDALPKSGGAMTGAITTNSTFDGRDVAADGTKLDGIEANATADQTNAEIRAAVEAASDSNAFTDADHSKLDAIESGATADQTAAEIKTAYESNSDTNAFTDADHSKLNGIAANANNYVLPSGYATENYVNTQVTNLVDSSPATLNTLNELAAALGDDPNFATTTANSIGTKAALSGAAFTGAITTNSTIDGRDVATDGTKLDGIEASADVTDTANVTAAGALMDSELTAIASVKGLDQGVATTDSPSFVNLTLSGTGSVKVPSGTTAQRDGSPVNGMFRYNSSNQQFEGYQSGDWGAIGGGGGSNTFTADTFTADGSTTAYALSQVINSENNLLVFIDGVFQQQSAYSIATASGTTTLTFSTAPANTREIIVYSVASAVSGSNLNTDSMTGDGSGVTLALSIAPVSENNTQVFIDGVYQNKDTYSISGTTLTFSTAPPTGSAVEVMTMTQTEVNVPVDGTITSAKLSGDLVTPSNLTVTGTATMDGLVVDTSAGQLDVEALGGSSVKVKSSGSLKLQGTGGSVDLINGSTEVLSTTSTGIDVTGTATMDGLTVDGNVGIGGSTITDVNLLNIQGSGASKNIGVVFNDTNTSKIFAIQNGGSALKFFDYTASAERMRIDSSGNVGIGTSSPSANLEIAQSGNNVGLLVAGGAYNYTAKFESSDAEANIIIEDSNSTNDGNMIGVATNDMYFITNASERMRIDSSGNLLVGKTSTSSGVVGHRFNPDGSQESTTNGGLVAYFNRKTSDGEIVRFDKDGAAVGSIGTEGGNLYIDGNAATGKTGIEFLGSAWYPRNDGSNSDGAVDLGDSSNRFKDLYLSGNALVGRSSSLSGQSGSVSANTVVSAHGGLQSHATSAGILEHYNDETLLRSYGANAGSGKLVFKVGGGGGSADSEAMRISSAGNLIMTAGGSIVAGGVNDLILNAGESGTPDIYLQSGGGTKVKIEGSNGNVGIGTSIPSSFNAGANNLVIGTGSGSEGMTIYGGGESNIFFADGTAGSSAYVGRIEYSHAVDNMLFYVNNSNAMTIDSSGRVGINNSSPVEMLTIGSTSDTNVRAQFLSSTTGANTIQFGDGTGASAYSGYINYTHSDNALVFATSSTERMRISSAGHTMFATTDDAPGAGNTQSGVAIRGGSDNRSFFSASSNYAMHLNRNTNDGEILYFAKNGTAVGSIGTNAATMYVSAPQAGGMKYSYYNSTNAVMLPVTTTGAYADGLHDLGYSAARFKDLYLSGGVISQLSVTSETEIASYNNNNATGAKYKISFKQNGTQVGVIEVGTSSTSYATSSDYRLKENVVGMSGATERLKQLKPSRFNFIADADTTVDGFLAHEVQDIVPEAISGTKDAMRDEEYEVTPAVLDDDGNVTTEAVMGTRSVPDYQGIDQSKLVPLLVATIQELEARITQLENN